MKKVKLAGWRGNESDSQVGQLLYYLIAVQLSMIKSAAPLPNPVLGLFMEEGMVIIQYAFVMWHTALLFLIRSLQWSPRWWKRHHMN